MSLFLNPTFIISMLIALSVHEAAHAWMAYRLGDHTAKVAGRLTLNPLAHLDPMGTILFILVGFGWGKPVPVNPYYFKNPRTGNALTALAGPVSNFLLALVAFLLLRLFFHTQTSDVWSLLAGGESTSAVATFFQNLLASLVFLNLGLMAFNLIPIAPLDGSKIIEPFVPLKYDDIYSQFMQYGPYILIGLLVAERMLNLSLLSTWISTIMDWVLMLFGLLI